MKESDKLDFKLPERPKQSNKGTFGKVLNIAGSKYMPGAAYLSSISALKIGCGYCFLATDSSVIDSVSAKTSNIVFVPFDKLKEQNPDVISIGCGLSTSDKAKEIFVKTLSIFKNTPMIIDADGLNILSTLKIKTPKHLIITPHPVEASRLLNEDKDKIINNIENSAIQLSKKYNCITVLKSHNTIVCNDNKEIYKNKTGNSALAKAGSGDILTGMISGLIAQGMNLYEGAKAAVYLHGRCAELASNELTEYSVMADDIINYIPKAIYENLSKQ